MPDVVRALVRDEESERGGDQVADLVEGARARRAEEGLQFGEGQFNRIEIGAVGRQESEARARLLNGGAHLGLFVDGEVVEHDDVARPQRRHEHLLNVGAEGDVVDGAVKHGRRGQFGRPKRGDDRVGLPVTARRVIADPRAADTARVPPQQVRGDAGFVDEDVLSRIVERERLAPLTPGRRDIRTMLFGGVYGFF